MSYLMTSDQLFNALVANKYIAVRSAATGREYGVNCNILKTKKSLTDFHVRQITWVQSYEVIDFMTYISIKTPFM